MLGSLSGGIKMEAGNMGGGLGGPSRSLMSGQGMDLLGMGMDFGGMKQEAPDDDPDVSNYFVHLPTCTSHLFLACVMLRHASGFPLPYDANPYFPPSATHA